MNERCHGKRIFIDEKVDFFFSVFYPNDTSI